MPSPHPVSGTRASRYIQSLPCVDSHPNQGRYSAPAQTTNRHTLLLQIVKEQPMHQPKLATSSPVKNQNQKNPLRTRLAMIFDLGPPANHLRPATPASNSIGGGERDRTDDLMLAKHALSQLSYTPRLTPLSLGPRLVGLGGFEPPTPALSRRCSNQLSYRPGL